MSRHDLILAVLLAGCSEPFLHLALPVEQDTGTEFLSLEQSGEIEYYVLDLAGAGLRLVELPVGSDARLQAIVIDVPFSNFGMEEGRFMPAGRDALQIPSGGTAFTATITDGAVGDWAQTRQGLLSLSQVRLPGLSKRLGCYEVGGCEDGDGLCEAPCDARLMLQAATPPEPPMLASPGIEWRARSVGAVTAYRPWTDAPPDAPCPVGESHWPDADVCTPLGLSAAPPGTVVVQPGNLNDALTTADVVQIEGAHVGPLVIRVGESKTIYGMDASSVIRGDVEIRGVGALHGVTVEGRVVVQETGALTVSRTHATDNVRVWGSMLATESVFAGGVDGRRRGMVTLRDVELWGDFNAGGADLQRTLIFTPTLLTRGDATWTSTAVAIALTGRATLRARMHLHQTTIHLGADHAFVQVESDLYADQLSFFGRADRVLSVIGGDAEVADVVIDVRRATEPDNPNDVAGAVVHNIGVLHMDRVLIDHNLDIGLKTEPMENLGVGNMFLTDVDVVGRYGALEVDADNGLAIIVDPTGLAELDRVRLRSVAHQGIFSQGEVRSTDLTIEETGIWAHRDENASAIRLLAGPPATLLRTRIVGAEGQGIFVQEGVEATIDHLDISGVRDGGAGRLRGGNGLVVDGAVEMRHFRIESFEDAGVQQGMDASGLFMEHGQIRNGPTGLVWAGAPWRNVSMSRVEFAEVEQLFPPGNGLE